MIERIDDQQNDAEMLQRLDDVVAVRKECPILIASAEGDLGLIGLMDEVDVIQDVFVVQLVFDACRGDAAMPFFLIVFVGDDRDRPLAPDLLP
jgi:hypothetical protein